MKKTRSRLIPAIKNAINNNVIGENKVSHYCFVDNTDTIHTHFNDICYARMRVDDGGMKELRIFFNQYQLPTNWFGSKGELELASKHFKMILNYPEFKTMFKNPRYFNTHGIDINIKDFSLQQIYFVATLLRMPYEFNRKGINRNIEMFMNNGFSLIQAFFLSQFFEKEKNGWSLCFFTCGHGVCDMNISRKNLKNFNISLFDGKKAYESANSFYGVYSKLSGEADGFIKDFAEKYLKKYGNGWDAKYAIPEDVMPQFILDLKEYINA